MNDVRNEFSAPLGSVTAGRLKFVRGADDLTINAGTSTADLYRARFDGNAPDIRVEDGTIRVEYSRSWRPLDWRSRHADVALNAAVPWAFEVRGGAARIDADLSRLRLEAFEIDGGASEVEMTLPEPSDTVRVRIHGGANNIKVRRPRGVAMRLHVGGGATNLVLDGQRLGAVGGDTNLESSGHAGGKGRYEIIITGGANDVSVLDG